MIRWFYFVPWVVIALTWLVALILHLTAAGPPPGGTETECRSQCHWWCVAPDGTVVDPTYEQFVGPGDYEEITDQDRLEERRHRNERRAPDDRAQDARPTRGPTLVSVDAG